MPRRQHAHDQPNGLLGLQRHALGCPPDRVGHRRRVQRRDRADLADDGVAALQELHEQGTAAADVSTFVTKTLCYVDCLRLIDCKYCTCCRCMRSYPSRIGSLGVTRIIHWEKLVSTLSQNDSTCPLVHMPPSFPPHACLFSVPQPSSPYPC
jgi:hypothetical protein